MPGDAVRLSCFYAAFFVFGGIHMPFWPVWLATKGIDPAGISLILASGICIKVLANPLVAHIADRSGARRSIMLALITGAIICFTAFFFVDGFGSILFVNMVFLALWAPTMPLGESLTLLVARTRGFDYGRVRLWGSLAFIVAAAGAGTFLAGRPGETILYLLLPAAVLVLLAIAGLPDVRAPAAGRLAVLELIVNRPFLTMLLACLLAQASHAAYYAFATLHWQAAGHSETVIGLLWAEGVLTEIILFSAGPALLRRLSPATLIIFAAVAGIVRWAAMAASTTLPVLVVVQALHAFTFGAAHLGAIHFIVQHVSPAVSASAMSFYSALVMGLGIGIAVFAVGPLYAVSPAGAFLAMTVLSAAALFPALVLSRSRD